MNAFAEQPEKAKKKREGKEWERQLRDGFRAADLVTVGLDDIGQQMFVPGSPRRTPRRIGDRVVCFRGRWLLMEAKECAQGFLARERFSADAEEALYKTTRDRGLAVVAIRYRPEGSRTWDGYFVHYADLMEAIRATGTKRLRLDKGIPRCFVPLGRKRIGEDRYWDVVAGIERLIEMKSPPPYHLDPEQEIGRRAKAEAKKQKRIAEAEARRPREECPF